ncbi:MAG TPA: biotin--[acetyl-CoA-carboxylase] ligase [Bryobacteraceae bacterium]|nr:biotin--[acetyl-CoA-carboxylase] ligase [Bryobacteraceae bacterium]
MIYRLATTGSTMNDAAALAKQGEPHGTAVVAEEQTDGIGRHGHSWHSEPGDGLYLSIILRLPPVPTLTMALGLAVQRAIDDVAQVATDLRWPNDVMLNGRKVAGVMVQAAEPGVLIAGIGINVNHSAFPHELAEIATSLRIETGHTQDKEALLQRTLAECLRHARLDKAETIRRFELHSTYANGKAVVVDEQVRGVTAGLDENGFLRLQTPCGIKLIMAGGVRPI